MAQLIWGMVLFKANALIYSELNKTTNYRHAENLRVGKRAANQYLGHGVETITITGKLAPTITQGRTGLQLLRAQADTGLPFPIIEGNGLAHGFYVLTDIQENDKHLVADGRPKIIDYTLTFKRVGDDKIDYSQIAQGLGALL